jgi:hypothetical protein
VKRREFLATAAAASFTGVRRRVLGEAQEGTSFISAPAVVPEDRRHYFTEQRLAELVDTTADLSDRSFEVVAYNFPSWHPNPFMEGIFGNGWTEWETLKKSRSLFPGHLMPKYPLWGHFDEADPEWAVREIDTAAGYGIGAWMVDWYWHSGTMFYQEQLEDGFLKASNRDRLKFALMWANHDWKDVYPAPSPDRAATILPQEHSIEDFDQVTSYCIDHYFGQSNYWRIDGALVFGIFDLPQVLKYIDIESFRRALDQMRERVHRAGLGELHIQANHIYSPTHLKALGIDSATRYHTFGWSYGGRPPGQRSCYGEGVEATIAQWKKDHEEIAIPYFPDCPVGWDDSPRFGEAAHIVVERTPDQYERLLRAAQYFMIEKRREPRIVYLSAWNEWTEDHFLLPDSVYGYSYLEAVARAFGRKPGI